MNKLKDILKSRKTLEVINYFYLHPDTYANQVRKELGLISGSCSNIIRNLKKLNILIPLKADKKKIRYRFTEKGLEIAKKINELLGVLK